MKIVCKKGIILGKTRFKESSLIVRTFTEDGSLVSLMFKGALRGKTNINARLLPFALLEFVFYVKSERSVHTASEVSVVQDFSEDISEYESQVRVAKYIRKVASLLKPCQSIPELFDITIALLRGWKELSNVPDDILWAGFMLKAMTFSGFAPAISLCASCGARLDDVGAPSFSPATGGFVCADCPPPTDAIATTNKIIETCQIMLSNPFKKYGKIHISRSEMKKTKEVLEKFWLYHIGTDERRRD